MVKRAMRAHRGAASDTEWHWLLAAPGHRVHLGHFPVEEVREHGAPVRLIELWDEYRDEIMEEWRTNPPDRLPFGHPVEQEMPPHLRWYSAPDPRRILGDPSPEEVREFEGDHDAWLAARRAWLASGEPKEGGSE